MKTNQLLFGASALLIAATTGTASAAVSIPAAGTTVNFAVSPSGADWASVSVAGGAADLTVLGTGATGIDAATIGVSATLAWPATATDWTAAANMIATEPAAISANAQVRYVTGTAKMLTGPTSNKYQALVGRFVNNAGAEVESLKLGWTLGVPVAPGGTGAVGTDTLAGIHVYWSLTGAMGSWTRLNGPHAASAVVAPATVTFTTPLPANAEVYFAWVDDNSPGSTTSPNLEGNFTIDDVAISSVVVATPKIAAAVTNVTRSPGVDAVDPNDDTFDFTLTVTGTGPIGAGWTVTSPAELTASGNYGTPHSYTGIPLGSFNATTHAIAGTAADTGTTATANFTVAAPWTTLTATGNTFVRGPGNNFTANLNVTGTYAKDTWTTNAGTITGLPAGGTYGVDAATDLIDIPVVGTPVDPANLAAPIAQIGPFTVQDTVMAGSASQNIYLLPPMLIGKSTVPGGAPDVISDGRLLFGDLNQSTWGNDPAVPMLQMSDGDNGGATGATDAGTTAKKITATYSLAGVTGAVKFSMKMIATDGSSGFEAADTFTARLVFNDGVSDLPPVNLVKASEETTVNGILAGAEIVGAGTAAAPVSRTHLFDSLIPDNIQSVRLEIDAICDSGYASEHMVVQDILFETAEPYLGVSAAATTFNNNNTVTPADDTITAAATITPYNLGASAGWTSDGTPASGLYSTANPVSFSALATASPVTVTLHDQGDALLTNSFIMTRPAATLTASLVAASIVRNANGPGEADDTVTFSLNVASTNAGPEFTLTSPAPFTYTGVGAYPPTGTPASITLGNIPAAAATINIVVSDASYPTVPAPVTVAIAIPAATGAAAAVMGHKDLGGGLADVLVGTPATAWLNFPAGPQMVMTAGAAADAVAESEVIDLTSVGEVRFTATLRARDTSAGSNFEATDKFKAELVVDGVTIIPLITAGMDAGNGAGATADPGTNGAANGYLNGYAGAAAADFLDNTIVYASVAADYDAHRERDEFNLTGEAAATHLNSAIALSALVPVGANNVKLKIYGAGAAGSEAFVVENVLFALAGPGPVDTDSDGMDDDYETANGLLPGDAADKFLDKDGDGQSNYAEFLAGTLAGDPASTLKVLAITAGAVGTVDVTVSTVSGKRYQLQESSDLGNADLWADVPGSVQTATGTTTTFTGIPVPFGGNVHHFLRAKVVP